MAIILPSPDAPLYAITDDSLSRGRPVLDVVRELLAAGVRIIQYREKHKDGGLMLNDCETIRAMTKEANACFIVNDHVDIAMLCDADGVHVGQDDLPVSAVRSLIGPSKIIGLSTHSPEQAIEATCFGIDYIAVGPLFPTKTKKNVCEAVGLEYLDWIVANSTLPFVAIGGIKRHNLPEVLAHGASSCALVSELLDCDDIQARTQDVLRIIKNT